MKAAPGVERLEVAGSLRRRKETIGDVDLLAQCEGDGTAVVDHFVAFPAAERVEAAGGTKGNIVLRSGLPIDLRVIPPRSFGAALQYFSGSKEHNVAMRTRAVRKGLRVNEWGVFRIPEGVDPESLGKEDGERVAGETEEDVYEALGMAWVPPELRENRGEVEAALDGTPAPARHPGRHPGRPADALHLERRQGVAGGDGAGLPRTVATSTWPSPTTARPWRWSRGSRRSGRGSSGRRSRRCASAWTGSTILRSAEVDILKDGALDMPDDDPRGPGRGGRFPSTPSWTRTRRR